jgi:diguanylate cyclase (GGDEF)-like protein
MRSGHDGNRAAPAVVRRRIALLVVTLAVPTALVLADITAAWPLFALPLALAVPLGGLPGLIGSVAVAGCAITVASGRPGADGAAMALGLGAFVAAGIMIGIGHAVQSAAAERARSVDFNDRLTAVASDEFFLDALERESARAERYGTPLSVVVLDMDRFTDFNRRFGAVAGDRMIEAAGEAIRALVRRSDIAARLDGGQFALLVPGAEQEAAALAQRILHAVSTLRVPASRGRQADATMSAGVATYEAGDDREGTALLDRAERALDDAKAGGRNRVTVFSPELRRWASTAA